MDTTIFLAPRGSLRRVVAELLGAIRNALHGCTNLNPKVAISRFALALALLGTFVTTSQALSPLVLSPPSGALPGGTIGQVYSQTITADDELLPTLFIIDSGSLPPGLLLTNLGTIQGTPTAAGSYTFTVNADAPPRTGTATYTIEIAEPVSLELSPATLSDGTVGTTYSEWLSTSGGEQPYSYEIVEGSLPDGITLVGANITGTPTSSGTSTFKVKVTDSASATGEIEYVLTVNPRTPVVTPNLEFLAAGHVGTPYSALIGAAQGISPYTFSITGGTLPPGLTLSTINGNIASISGMPSTSGTFEFTVGITDSGGGTPGTGSSTFKIVIQSGGPAITPSEETVALKTGEPHSKTINASGGASPYAFETSGTLPPGLSFHYDGELAEITGTPTVAGTYVFEVILTDANQNSTSATYTYVVGSQSGLSLTPSGGALPEAMVGENYHQPVTASGGTGPVLYSLASGKLPKGLILNISTGELNGPLAPDAVAGNYSFTILATDANEKIIAGSFTLKVGPRRVTAPDKVIEVPAGSTPADVYLNDGATGGPFVSAETTFVEPANAGVATITRGKVAALGPVEEPIGWYLQFKPNPSFSGTAKVGYRLTSALGISNTGTISYKLSYDPAEVATEIDSLVHGFVQTRQSLIASTIKVPGLLERRQAGRAAGPVSVTATPSGEGLALGFASSLAQVEAARNAAEGGTQLDPSRYNVWIDGAVLAHQRDDNGGKWGTFGMLNLGADYLLTEKLLLGLSFHYDRMSDPTDEDAKLTGNGWLVGPYASVGLGKNVFWDTSLLYGGSANDIDTAFWDGSFDTTRWLIDSALKGQWLFANDVVLTPKLRAVYFNEKVDDYTVRNGAGDELTIDGFDAEQFRVSFGAEVARSFTLGNGTTVTPRFGATGGYSALDGSGAFGSLTAGVSFQTSNALTIDTGVLFNLSDGGDQSIGARASIAKRF